MKSTYFSKLISAAGVQEYAPDNPAQSSWDTTLQQLRYDADVVFFGDSITRSVDFQSYFPDYKIVNLGVSGDNLTQMNRRTSTIAYLSPEMIFIMGGVNSLDDLSVNNATSKYRSLIGSVLSSNPSAKVFIQSILPISVSAHSRRLTNKSIIEMNTSLQNVAEEYGAVYIDVHSAFIANGSMNPLYTVDGVHLSNEGKELWIDILRQYIR